MNNLEQLKKEIMFELGQPAKLWIDGALKAELSIVTTNWLDESITTAYQAGIDEERKRIAKAYEDYCDHDIDLADFEAALQDNK